MGNSSSLITNKIAHIRQLVRNGELDTAIDMLEAILKAYPEIKELYPLLCKLYIQILNIYKGFFNEKRLNKAYEIFSQLTKVSYKNHFYWYSLGIISGALNKLQESGGCFENAIFIRPDYAEAYLTLGDIHKILANNEKAFNNFIKAAELRIKKPELYFDIIGNKANWFEEKGISALIWESQNNGYGEIEREVVMKPICAFPWNRLTVKVNGDVVICCMQTEPIGNLQHESFDAIWNEEKIRISNNLYKFGVKFKKMNPRDKRWDSLLRKVQSSE